ncbi:MAG TPA: ABC transporter substrate-binding protein [Thermodesulfobacteriota bacterium]|nr:ABC transporter substrate-binding protein [Thermodesulfobacteriota bacterium]
MVQGNRWVVWGTFFLLLSGLVWGPATVGAQEVIKVGIILPLTGEKAKFGEIEKNSFVMALNEINKAGGIKGKKIELLIEDDTGKPDIARAAVEKLVSKDNVVMLGGGYGSSETYSIAGVAQQKKIPFLINTGSADDITEKGWNYVFRLNPPVSEYANAAESFYQEVAKPKTAVILFENTLFGTSGSKDAEKTLKAMGVQVLLKEGYEHGAVDFKPLLIKVKNANPDLIYMISYVMDAALLMRQSMELDINPKMFVGGGAGFTLPDFFQNAGKAAEGVFSADLWVPTLPYPGAMDYFKNYKKQFGKETEYHGAEAYAAMQVIADVLKRAKSFSAEDIRQALAATDMMTVFGKVKFASYGKMTNQNKVPTYLVQWIKGKLECVWPKEVATAPYQYPHKAWKSR